MGETISILFGNNPIPSYVKFLFDFCNINIFHLFNNRVNQLDKSKEN